MRLAEGIRQNATTCRSVLSR